MLLGPPSPPSESAAAATPLLAAHGSSIPHQGRSQACRTRQGTQAGPLLRQPRLPAVQGPGCTPPPLHRQRTPARPLPRTPTSTLDRPLPSPSPHASSAAAAPVSRYGGAPPAGCYARLRYLMWEKAVRVSALAASVSSLLPLRKGVGGEGQGIGPREGGVTRLG